MLFLCMLVGGNTLECNTPYDCFMSYNVSVLKSDKLTFGWPMCAVMIVTQMTTILVSAR